MDSLNLSAEKAVESGKSTGKAAGEKSYNSLNTAYKEQTKLTLNPADLTVDESLPAYPFQLSFGKPALSDEDAEAGSKLRIDLRKNVVDTLNFFISTEKGFKADTKKGWEKMTEAEKAKAQQILDLYKKPEYLAFIKAIKTEVVWWNNNTELSPRAAKERFMIYNEKIGSLRAALDNAKASMGDTKFAKKEKEDAEKKAADLKRTAYDDVLDSLGVIGQTMFWIVYVLVGLRCASFAANEILYKPLPYRLLVFVYTFLFVPIFGPYYLWVIIKSMIWKTPAPMYEGLFPITPYDPSEPLNLNRRLFGYADTPQIREWMTAQQQKETVERDAAVVSKNIKQEIIAEHSK
jgi:hypothetical protein